MFINSHHRMKNYLSGSLLLVVACISLGCYDCGPQAEPTIQLNIDRSSLPTLYRISALGTQSDSAFLRALEPGLFGNTVGLPVSMLQDSTTYLLYSENQTDTLTLFYKRIFDIKKQCGYYIDLAEPDASPRFRTTIANVSVEYNSYLGPTRWNRSRPLGIIVTTRNP